MLAEGYWLRRWLMAGCLLVHGLRMFTGALVLFGTASNWSFRFAQDLPRYRFAQLRWETSDGMPRATWWLKAQHDTLAQCLANSVPLVRAAARVTFSKLLRAPGRF